MRLACTILIALALVATIMCIEMSLNRERDREIKALQVKVDALQLVASGQIQVPKYDGTKVIRPKVIKY